MSKHITTLFYITAGGGAGTLLRYGLTQCVSAILGRGFPYGILLTNMIGSALMGYFYVLFSEKITSTELRAGLLVGFLGGFTTFSSFSLDTLKLLEAGSNIKAIMNILLTVILCLIGCWAGMIIARQY